MPFPYEIIPNTSNAQRPFRARVKLGLKVLESDLLPAVAADSGVSQADVTKVIRSLFKVMIGFLRDGRPIGNILRLFKGQPTISGSFPTPDPAANDIRAGVGISITIGPDADDALHDQLAVEKVGEHGTVQPEPESVVLSPGGQANVYSLTAALKVNGHNFRGSGANQTWPVVRLIDAVGTLSPVPLTVFACSQTELLLSPAPAGTAGLKRLEIQAGWDNAIMALYAEPLAKQP